MAYRPDLADVAFLRSAEGVDALSAADDLPLTPASALADTATVRALVGTPHAAAVLSVAALRRRAAWKLADPDRWLLTDEALQQATPSAVAAHRAQRLAGRDVHDLTCSVGAELAALEPAVGRLLGSDLDPVRLAMAAHNVPGVALARADALHPVSRGAVGAGAVLLADPARRDRTGRRRWHSADLEPPLDDLVAAAAGRDLVVKAAPGLDRDAVGWAGEVELVSLDSRVREAALWSPGLGSSGSGTPGVRRRATVLSSTGPGHAVTTETITDADPDGSDVRPPGQWLLDPDGAIVRAGLVRHWAARHGLGQLDPRIAYLTGDVPPPGTRAFRVLEHGRYTEKSLRAALRRRDAGAVEILVRGVDVDPNALRPRLRLRGPAALTVVLTRIGDVATALLCRPERIPPA